MNGETMTSQDDVGPPGGGPERRIDGPADKIDEAVVIATVQGVGPAIEHMSEAGITRPTALRVLSSPEHHRVVKGGTLSKVLGFLGIQLPPRG